MKKIISLAVIAAATFMCACTNEVYVDSPDNPNASYNNLTGNFTAFASCPLSRAFDATNKALDNDMQFYRMSQTPGDNTWEIRSRALLDKLIVVKLQEVKAGRVKIEINYDGGNLAMSQKIYKAIISHI